MEQKGQLKKIGKRKESLDTKEEERTIQTKGKYNYKWNAELDSKTILIYFRIQKENKRKKEEKGNTGIRNSN